jgi:hypothetical protein
MRSNETADGLTRSSSASGFVGLEPTLGSQRGISVIRLVAGWATSTRDNGKMVIPNNRLKN